jgi:hypothetical protein
MLERSAGKLARSVLRGLGEREPTWLPGGSPEMVRDSCRLKSNWGISEGQYNGRTR